VSRACTVCTHPRSAEIDQAIVSRDGSLRRIAAEAGLSESALRRHREHIDTTLAKAAETLELDQANELLEKVRTGFRTLEALEARLATILADAWGSGDRRTALASIREFTRVRGELRANIELMARLQGQLPSAPEVNVLMLPMWIELRSRIIQTLLPFPDARAAVARALTTIDAAAPDVEDNCDGSPAATFEIRPEGQTDED
jgi:hypothetical protein